MRQAVHGWLQAPELITADTVGQSSHWLLREPGGSIAARDKLRLASIIDAPTNTCWEDTTHSRHAV